MKLSTSNFVKYSGTTANFSAAVWGKDGAKKSQKKNRLVKLRVGLLKKGMGAIQQRAVKTCEFRIEYRAVRRYYGVRQAGSPRPPLTSGSESGACIANDRLLRLSQETGL